VAIANALQLEIAQSRAELLTILRICTRYVTLWIDLWPLDLELLQNFGCHALL